MTHGVEIDQQSFDECKQTMLPPDHMLIYENMKQKSLKVDFFMVVLHYFDSFSVCLCQVKLYNK